VALIVVGQRVGALQLLSIPSGGHGFDAAWVVPGQTTVITDKGE
jgi:hypothetical protein